MKKKIEKSSKKDQFTVVLESIENKFDILIDHQKTADDRFHEFRNDTQDSFRTLADYLARIEAEIHGEFETKINLKEFAALQKRVEQLEKSLRVNRLVAMKG